MSLLTQITEISEFSMYVK